MSKLLIIIIVCSLTSIAIGLWCWACCRASKAQEERDKKMIDLAANTVWQLAFGHKLKDGDQFDGR